MATDLLSPSQRPAPSTAGPIRPRSERTSVATCSVRDRPSHLTPVASRGRTNSSFAPSKSAVSLGGRGGGRQSTSGLSGAWGKQQQQQQATPITDKVLEIAKGMDDPKASDLKFLLEDAKMLHQKLLALNTEGVDLKKVGLFSNEVLNSIEASKRPKVVVSQRAATLAAASRRTSVATSDYSYTSKGLSAEKKSKSLKRSILGAFGRHRQSSECQSPRTLPRNKSMDAALQRQKKVVSLSRPGSPKRSRSSKESVRRSSSLDCLDQDSDPSQPSPASSSATPPNSPSLPVPERRESSARQRLARSLTGGFGSKKSSKPPTSPRLRPPRTGDRAFPWGAQSMPNSPLSPRGSRGNGYLSSSGEDHTNSLSSREESRSPSIPIPQSSTPSSSPPRSFKTARTPPTTPFSMSTPPPPRRHHSTVAMQRSVSYNETGSPAAASPRPDFRPSHSATLMRMSSHSPSPQPSPPVSRPVSGTRPHPVPNHAPSSRSRPSPRSSLANGFSESGV